MPHNALKRRAAKAVAPPGDPLKVLIVDDSVVARAAISRMIDGTARFKVSAAVGSARAARAFLADHRVDIVLLDIEMPGIDGLTALPDLLAAAEGAKILIVASSASVGAAASVQALALGAADTLVKPEAGGLGSRFADVLEERLLRLVDQPLDLPAALPVPPAPRPRPAISPFDIVAIGASTGGIHALSALLRVIPPAVDVPILITQHLPSSFMPYFAAQLALLARRPCDVATDHMRIRRGRIVIAPGDGHMRIVRTSEGAAIRLSLEPATSGCMPSVDPMFASIAESHGQRALCVVLSGMGRDGSIGAASVLAAGGAVVVQDRASSVVWGMPGAIAATGTATAILTPDAIGKLIAERRRPR